MLKYDLRMGDLYGNIASLLSEDFVKHPNAGTLTSEMISVMNYLETAGLYCLSKKENVAAGFIHKVLNSISNTYTDFKEVLDNAADTSCHEKASKVLVDLYDALLDLVYSAYGTQKKGMSIHTSLRADIAEDMENAIFRLSSCILAFQHHAADALRGEQPKVLPRKITKDIVHGAHRTAYIAICSALFLKDTTELILSKGGEECPLSATPNFPRPDVMVRLAMLISTDTPKEYRKIAAAAAICGFRAMRSIVADVVEDFEDNREISLMGDIFIHATSLFNSATRLYNSGFKRSTSNGWGNSITYVPNFIPINLAESSFLIDLAEKYACLVYKSSLDKMVTASGNSRRSLQYRSGVLYEMSTQLKNARTDFLNCAKQLHEAGGESFICGFMDKVNLPSITDENAPTSYEHMHKILEKLKTTSEQIAKLASNDMPSWLYEHALELGIDSIPPLCSILNSALSCTVRIFDSLYYSRELYSYAWNYSLPGEQSGKHRKIRASTLSATEAVNANTLLVCNPEASYNTLTLKPISAITTKRRVNIIKCSNRLVPKMPDSSIKKSCVTPKMEGGSSLSAVEKVEETYNMSLSKAVPASRIFNLDAENEVIKKGVCTSKSVVETEAIQDVVEKVEETYNMSLARAVPASKIFNLNKENEVMRKGASESVVETKPIQNVKEKNTACSDKPCTKVSSLITFTLGVNNTTVSR